MMLKSRAEIALKYGPLHDYDVPPPQKKMLYDSVEI